MQKIQPRTSTFSSPKPSTKQNFSYEHVLLCNTTEYSTQSLPSLHSACKQNTLKTLDPKCWPVYRIASVPQQSAKLRLVDRPCTILRTRGLRLKNFGFRLSTCVIDLGLSLGFAPAILALDVVGDQTAVLQSRPPYPRVAAVLDYDEPVLLA